MFEMLETLTSAHTVMNYGITCTWVIAHDSFFVVEKSTGSVTENYSCHFL